VLQDDKMLGTLTVREHLEFVAMLRLPSSMPYGQKMRKVDEILEELGIQHISDSLIGTDMIRGISGGERKRLSIASELVTDPSILFLDEPTSGLDSSNAYSLMKTLQRLASNKDRTIIISIHQPRSNIFNLFDYLLLLSHGEMVYFGDAAESIQYFHKLGSDCPEHYNPADFLIDLMSSKTSEEIRNLSDNFKRTMEANDPPSVLVRSISSSVNFTYEDPTDSESDSEYASSWLQQCLILSSRTILNSVRNPYLIKAQYALIIALSVFIGKLPYRNPSLANSVPI